MRRSDLVLPLGRLSLIFFNAHDTAVVCLFNHAMSNGNRNRETKTKRLDMNSTLPPPPLKLKEWFNGLIVYWLVLHYILLEEQLTDNYTSGFKFQAGRHDRLYPKRYY